MPGAGADDAIVPPAALREAQASAATVAWRRLDAPSWPVPPAAFPPGAALVGGAVRDALLDRLGPRPDLDLVLPGDAVEACRQLRRRHGGSAVVLDAERSIARLVVDGWSIDLARQEGGCLEADLQRRDYTINAMALPLASPDQLVDPLGGAAHLVNGELVAVAEANLLDDPLRLLRGLRLAAELDFRLETRTQGWIAIHAPRLATVAGERVLAELEKLAAAPEGHRQLREVLRCGLLAPWRGETPTATADSLAGAALLSRLGVAEADQLGLTPAERGDALPLARLAAVLDEPSLQRLRSSRRWQQRVGSLRHWRQRLGSLEPAAAAAALPEPERLRLQRQLEQDLPALLLGWPAVEGRVWLARWRDGDDPLFHPRPAIDGGTLQRELGIEASPRLGALLEHLMRERAFGRVQQRHELLQQARSWLHSAHGDGDQDPRRG